MFSSRTTIGGALARAGGLLIALAAGPALANQALIEAHATATYRYVLGKGEAAGRGSLAAGAGAKTSKARLAETDQGANRLAQCPGCKGESAIAPPRGMH
ncbi:MAG TPA: hypothetical protein VFK92_17730 [Burkholderiales bacterium]|nr:hypothetical protein [Burkholderiales bacterium]